MTTAVLPTNGHMWLAGNPGPPPSPLAVALLLIVLAGAFGTIGTLAWIRRRREAPLRREIQAQPLTFRSPVRVRADFFGTMASLRGMLHLNVYSNGFEILDALPPVRFVFGFDYCYRARDTSIEVIRGALTEWIEITGHPAGSAVQAQIRSRGMNRQLWDVLVAAGARPVGQPPQR